MRLRQSCLRRLLALAALAGIVTAFGVVAAPAPAALAAPPPAYEVAGRALANAVAVVAAAYAPNGDLYTGDTSGKTVMRYPAAGGSPVLVTGIAGQSGFTGDGGPATSAKNNIAYGFAFDGADVYFSDYGNHRIRKIDSAGIITTIAGSSGTGGFSGDGGPATSAELDSPTGLAVIGDNLYVSDSVNDRIRKIVLRGAGAGTITTAVGTSTDQPLSDGDATTVATLDTPTGIFAAPDGSLTIADTRHNAVRKWNPGTGSVTTIVGTGTRTSSSPNAAAGYAATGGDGGPATAATMYDPRWVAYDSAGNLLVSDAGNNRIRRVDASTGNIAIVVGTGTPTGGPTPGRDALSADGRWYALAVSPSDVIAASSLTMANYKMWRFGASPSLTSAAPASAQTGVAYSHTFSATSTPATPTWSMTSGSLPAGLTLTAGGVLSGTPTATGSSTFSVTATNGIGLTAVVPVTLDVNAAAVITSAAPSSGRAGAAYTHTFTATGSPTPTWSVTSGILPAGLSLTSGGVLSGTPTSAGSTTFSVTATNGIGTPVSTPVTLNIAAVPVPASASAGLLAQQITTSVPTSMPLSARTAAVNAVASAGGQLTYTAGTPAVCSVDAYGVLAAVKSGTCTVTVTAAATSTHAAAVKNLTVTITAAQTTTATLPSGPQRFAGPERVTTSADIAEKIFTTPAAGTSRDVVLATAGSFADALAGSRLAGQVGGPLLLTDGRSLSDEVAAQVKRLVAAGGNVYVLGGDEAISDAVAKATSDLVTGDSVVRVGGDTRYETAVAVADATVKKAGDVGPIYLVTGKDFADGVSVGAYAQSTGGVVLLTDGDKLPAATAKYLADHDPNGARAIAIGGPAKAAAANAGLSSAAQRAVVGADRYETSAKLAAAMKAGTSPASSSSWSTTGTAATAVSSVGLAGGASWPDALSGSAAMAALGGPLLLTPTGSEALPTATASALSGLGAQRVLVFGGTSVIPGAAFDRAGGLLDS